MIYGSVCSGIEAATAAWHPLGWKPAFFSEIDKFPRAVLAHHYPDVPCHGDFTTIRGDEYGAIDVLVGGTPCQDFSVAGLRAGVAGERGNLTLEFLRLAARTRPRWVVWENVPGVLSIDGGRTFGAFLGGLAELGYGFAYRVLDAQYFGLAQRRQRVFVVGYLGDWRRAAAVLFERESLSGYPAPRREAGEGVAPTIAARTKGGGGLGTDFDCDGGLIHAFGGNNTSGPIDIATACQAHGGPHGRQDFGSETFVTHSLRAHGFDASRDGTGRGTPLVTAFEWQRGASQNLDMLEEQSPALIKSQTSAIAFSVKDHGADAGEIAPTLRSGGHDKSHANGGVMPAVAFMENQRGELRTSDVTDSLKGGGGKPGQGYQAVAFSIMPMNSGKDFKGRETDIAQPVMAGGPVGGNQGGDYVVFAQNQLGEVRTGDVFNTLNTNSNASGRNTAMVAHFQDSEFGCKEYDTAAIRAGRIPEHSMILHPEMAVRRLTPRECCRLQGFPDDYLDITYRGKLAADGPKYKALGNSMAVPVMAHIGRRIALVERLANEGSI